MKNKTILATAIVLIGAIAITKYSFTGKATATPSGKILPANDNMTGWSEASKTAVMMMKKKYGEPAEKSESMMMWKNNGQWKKTVVYAKEFKHDWPMPHTDVMQQWIDYRVPPEKFSDLAMFDGSVVCNRTNGEISARCEEEGANFLAINLANDIVTGKKDSKSARNFYAQAVKEMGNGGKPAYMERLQFNVSVGGTVDTDKQDPAITQDDIMKVKQQKEKMKKEMMDMKDMGMDGKDKMENK
jgi:hypothetical protein